MADPEVTVIIPAHNSAHTVERAVQSVLGQSFHDFEIILVDDASSDPAVETVESLDDVRVRIIRRAKNGGTAEARNTGIRESNGTYIALLDADDMWLPKKLEIQVSALRQASQQIAASCTGSWIIQAGTVRRHIPAQPQSWLKSLLMGTDLGSGTTLLIRRSAYDTVGFYDNKFARYEDLDWLLRYAKAFDLDLLTEPLARIFRGPTPEGPLIEESTRYLIEKNESTFRIFGPRYYRKAIAKRWLTVGWYYYYMDKRNLHKEREYFSKAVRTYPLQRPHAFVALFDSIFATHIWMGLTSRLGLRKYHR